jgi:hypothetical protein
VAALIAPVRRQALVVTIVAVTSAICGGLLLWQSREAAQSVRAPMGIAGPPQVGAPPPTLPPDWAVDFPLTPGEILDQIRPFLPSARRLAAEQFLDLEVRWTVVFEQADAVAENRSRAVVWFRGNGHGMVKTTVLVAQYPDIAVMKAGRYARIVGRVAFVASRYVELHRLESLTFADDTALPLGALAN